MKTKKNKKLTAAIAIGLCIILAAAAVVPFAASRINNIVKRVEGVYASGSITVPESYDDVARRLSLINLLQNDFYLYGSADMEMVVEDAVEESVTTDSAINSAAGSADYSDTNVQVQGVDEQDIIKTDGTYIYMLRNQCLTIVDTQSMSEVSHSTLGNSKWTNTSGMYLKGDLLCVVNSISDYARFMYSQDIYNSDGTINDEKYKEASMEYEGSYGNDVLVEIYDISDRSAPKLINTLTQSGYLTDTRMVGSYLYLVTTYHVRSYSADDPTTYIPMLGTFGEEELVACENIIMPETSDSTSYSVIGTIDINNASDFVDSMAILGSADTVYADSDSLVVADATWSSEESEQVESGENVVIRTSGSNVDIFLFSFADGDIEHTASGRIRGSLLNQFAIDEHNGYYRFVVTENNYETKIYTDGVDRYEYNSYTGNALYVLNDKLEPVGALENVAEDETVYSVRFEGDIAYFVTFRQTDPLFAVDLSDPTDPTILSALKIPGFSTYMHRYDETSLFGIGYDADEDTGWTTTMKMTMFDTTDPADVTERHTFLLDSTYSEALYNHKAILISAEKNIIAFPNNTGYVVYGYDRDSGFYQRAEVRISDWVYGCRGLFIGDRFYVKTENSVEVFDLNDFSELGSIALTEISDEYDYYYYW